LDIEALYGGRISSEPVIDEQFMFTSSVIVQVEGELLMFIGTSNGRLLKVSYSILSQCAKASKL